MKTRQVMKLSCNGVRLVCIHDDKTMSYKLYKVAWYNGGDHRKLCVTKDTMAEILMWMYNADFIRHPLQMP